MLVRHEELLALCAALLLGGGRRLISAFVHCLQCACQQIGRTTLVQRTLIRVLLLFLIINADRTKVLDNQVIAAYTYEKLPASADKVGCGAGGGHAVLVAGMVLSCCCTW